MSEDIHLMNCILPRPISVCATLIVVCTMKGLYMCSRI